jgi:hypothetical protein
MLVSLLGFDGQSKEYLDSPMHRLHIGCFGSHEDWRGLLELAVLIIEKHWLCGL